MGIHLITEIMDHAPSMTPTEWKALIVLAEDANDTRRTTWTSVTDDKITRRVGLDGEAWKNLRGTLVRKKLLEIAEPARRGYPARYRFPNYRPLGHEIDAPTVLGHGSGTETGPLGHGTDAPTGDLGHESDALTAPLGHGTHAETARWGIDPMPPILTPLSSSKSLSSGTPPEASAPVPVDNSGDGERDTPPQPQPPNLAADDIADAWAKARADQGVPASTGERANIRSGAAELLAAGQAPEYLTRVACWMATYHPGWADLGRARTAAGAPSLLPAPRTPDFPPSEPERTDRPPCTVGGCYGHDHGPCDRTGFLDDRDSDVAARCPCWFTVEARF